MGEYYVRPRAAVQKLEEAKKTGQPVYIYGASGYGKTALIRNFFGYRKVTYQSCADNQWRKIETQKNEVHKRLSVYLYDDLQLLANEDKKAEIISLLNNRGVWVILVSRGKKPDWLSPASFSRSFCMIREDDLRLTQADAKKLAALYDLKLSDRDIAEFLEIGQANGYAFGLAMQDLADGFSIQETIRKVSRTYQEHMLNDLIPSYDPNVRDLMTKLSVTDHFTAESAAAITRNKNAQKIIRKAVESTNFIIRSGDGWSFRAPAAAIFRLYAAESIGEDEIRACAMRAGRYYEEHAMVPEALKMYERAGNGYKLFGLLAANARENPEVSYFYEMRRHYLLLPEDAVKMDPYMMAALSMVCSLMMDTDRSETWYGRLISFRDKATGNSQKAAEKSLAYLDIALPHHGITGMIDFLEKWYDLSRTNSMKLPEFSLTSNLPSVINGGKDFSEWSKKDDEIIQKYGKMICLALGNYGKGLISEALGESYYEKGRSSADVLKHLSNVLYKTALGGRAELAFAAVGIQCRLYISEGEIGSAKKLLLSFRNLLKQRAVIEEMAGDRNDASPSVSAKKVLNKLLPSIRTLECRMALYEGNMEVLSTWMRTAPDENQEFFIMERYRYLTKIRCYIAEKNYMAALALVEKMKTYAKQYKRIYVEMEAGLLSAIVKFRIRSEWNTEFIETLRKLSEYHFVSLIAEEAGAVYQLLCACTDKASMEGIDQEFYSEVLKKASFIASKYPLYLKETAVTASPELSDMALKVLRLLEQGYTVQKTAETLGTTVNNVRYHAKVIYRKFNVNSKTEAVLAAKNLGLL